MFVVAGRVRYERLHRNPVDRPLSARAAERLVTRAAGRPRTEWGRWRRVTALQRLERARHPAVPRLLRRVLHDRDPTIAAAAVRTLGDIGDDWAIDLLVDALRDGEGSRSRIASELERLAPAPGPEARCHSSVTGTRSFASGARPCFGRIRNSASLRSSSSPGTPTRTSVRRRWRRWERAMAARSRRRCRRDSTTVNGSSASTPREPWGTSSARKRRLPSRGCSPIGAGGCASGKGRAPRHGLRCGARRSSHS